jgi:glucosylceramidase
VLIVSTSKNGLRFKQSTAQFGSERHKIEDEISQSTEPPLSSKNVISINQNDTFQKIIGFGNAFTGAVSYNLELVPNLKDHIYKNYFSKETGIALNMIRIPIGGCDFDLEPWAYNESPENDLLLTNFTKLDQRDLDRIEQLKNLIKVSGNSEIKFVGAAWR